MSLMRKNIVAKEQRSGKKPVQIKNGRTQDNYYNGKTAIVTKSRTEQQHKDEVQIQNILRKYKKTGVLTHTAQFEGTYMDMADAPQFMEAQNIIAAAKSMFESLPSNIRKDMENSPQKFVEFMQNEENREAMLEYGLSDSHLPPVKEKPAIEPQPAPKAEPPPEAP